MASPAEDPRPVGSSAEGTAGIVVPIRSFTLGKVRLAPALDDTERTRLVRAMADHVVAAAAGHRVAVVSSAREVVQWAHGLGLEVLPEAGSLDAAAAAGRDWARAGGLDRYAIVHADLPRAAHLDAVLGDGAAPVAVIVPDHHDDGTPVLVLPAASDFTFAYGPGSASRHAAEAQRRGLTVRVVRDPDLAFDVDDPDDLAALHGTPGPIAR